MGWAIFAAVVHWLLQLILAICPILLLLRLLMLSRHLQTANEKRVG